MSDIGERCAEAVERQHVMRRILAIIEAHNAVAIRMHPNMLAWLKGESK